MEQSRAPAQRGAAAPARAARANRASLPPAWRSLREARPAGGRLPAARRSGSGHARPAHAAHRARRKPLPGAPLARGRDALRVHRRARNGLAVSGGGGASLDPRRHRRAEAAPPGARGGAARSRPALRPQPPADPARPGRPGHRARREARGGALAPPGRRMLGGSQGAGADLRADRRSPPGAGEQGRRPHRLPRRGLDAGSRRATQHPPLAEAPRPAARRRRRR